MMDLLDIGVVIAAVVYVAVLVINLIQENTNG